jgi:hypothetical protein
MMNFEIEVEHLIEIEGVDAGDSHAQGVADEIAHVMILEEGWILSEDGTILGLFDIGFESHESVFAGLVEQVIHHFQSVDVGLLSELGAAEDSTDAASNLLEDMERIRDEESADGGAADDDQFRRLHKYPQVPVFHEIAGHHTTEDNDDSDNRKHA